jgi:CRISPR-associated protein Csd1
VSYALSLSHEGELVDVVPLLQEVEQGKKTVLRPRVIQVPAAILRSGTTPKSNFLWDNSSFMLGIDNKNPERAKECFLACAKLHQNILEEIDSPVAQTILNFFALWHSEEGEKHPVLEEYLKEIKAGVNLIFRVNGQFAHEDSAIAAAWQRTYGKKEEGQEAVCIVTGQKDTPVRLHPKIKGVRGAQAVGANLISFDKGSPAYSSYEKSEGENAPTGEFAAFAYGTALNALLANREHTQQLGDTTLVFWAKGGDAAYQACAVAMFFGGGDNSEMTASSLKAAMTSLANGESTRWADAEISPETPFYILGLAPNAARLSVRFFLRDSFGTFARRIWEHQQRLEIVRPALDKREELSFWQLLQETVNQNAREKKASPVLEGELVRAVLTGGSYPATLLNGVMLRIRAEREVTRGRAAIIKAYYLKNEHRDCPKKVLTVELNESKHRAYLLGRAFSVLEAIQQAANPGINTTIKDKYFNSASATPATIFPILINLAQHHLRKLETGLHIYYEKELTSILGGISDFPTRLTLPGQGAFQLGYYHQTQKRYEKKQEG